MRYYIVTDKLFPFDRDGGTAYTSFEWASFLNTLSDKTTLVYHGNKDINSEIVNFDVIKLGNPIEYLNFFKTIRAGDLVFLNSAFKFWELFYFILKIHTKIQLFWLSHGSFDRQLTTTLKKKLYMRFWASRFVQFVNSYICNSAGEFENLPDRFKKHAIVIENLFPEFSINFEKATMHKQVLKMKAEKGYFLIFGRIDPKKRILETINHLHKIGFFNSYCLRIAGPAANDNYLSTLKEAIENLNIEKNCIILPRQFDDSDKLKILSESTCLLLFSESEGLPIVILEGLLLGKNVICSEGCNVGHLNDVLTVKNLSKITMSDLSNFEPIPRSIQSYDIGRTKLLKFYDYFNT